MGRGTGHGPAAGPTLIGIVVLAGAAGVWVASRPMLRAPDPFWHIALGRGIVETSSLPRQDPYSFLTVGQDWVVNQWGTDLLIGLTEMIGGLPLVAIATAVLVSLGVGVTGYEMWRRSPSLVSLGLIALVAMASMPNWLLRGNLFTFVLLPLLLQELHRSRPRFAILGALFVIWANLHAAYLLGIALVMLDVAGRFLVTPRSTKRTVARRAGATIVVALMASLITPYGPGFVASTFELVARAGSAPISEWAPPILTDPQVLPFSLLVAAVLVSLGLIAQREDLPDILCTVGGVLVGFSASRNVAPAAIILGVVGAPYVHEALRQMAQLPPAGPTRSARSVDRSIAWAATVLAMLGIGIVVPRSSNIADHGGGVPFAIITELDDLDREARVTTPSSWAPAVSTLTGPRVRTEVDGRIELFSDSQFHGHLSLHRGMPGWEDRLDAWCVTDAVLPANSPLHGLLATHGHWETVARIPVHKAVEEEAVWLTRDPPVTACG